MTNVLKKKLCVIIVYFPHKICGPFNETQYCTWETTSQAAIQKSLRYAPIQYRLLLLPLTLSVLEDKALLLKTPHISDTGFGGI